MATKFQRTSDGSISLAIGSVALGVIVTSLLITFSGGDTIIDIIGGVVVAILTLQLGELWHHRQLVPRLSSLERAAANDHLYRLLVSQIDAVEQINQLNGTFSQSSRFVEEKLEETFNRLNDELEVLCRGQVNIDNEARELTSNADFLVCLPEHEVRAVSYQDEEFWDEPEGIKFLEAHRKVIENGIKVSRVFILPEAKVDGQKSLILAQAKMGINCSIVIEDKLDAGFREDFVLYDCRYVRFAQLVAQTPTNQLKHATLTFEEDKLRHYIEKFGYLATRSTEATKCYEDRAGAAAPAKAPA